MRYLEASEVECRIGRISQNGRLNLLLYKDARCDMRVLDEVFGPENWQCEYSENKGTLFCRIGVLTSNGWVWKEDAGAPSNVEAQKGEASDAFKRAGFRWCIGRELYTAPDIWIDKGNYTLSNGKCYDEFQVEAMEVSEGRITHLSIRNAKLKKNVYSWDALGVSKAPNDEEGTSTPKDRLQGIRDLMKPYMKARQLDGESATREICEWAGVERMPDLPEEMVPDVELMMQEVIGGVE